MSRESSATLSDLEQLPPELLLVVFEFIRLDSFPHRPQRTTPFSRTLLPYMRRNLFRNIIVRSYTQLAALVANHANPEIPPLIRTIQVIITTEPGWTTVPEVGNVGWGSIRKRDIFDFFCKTVQLKRLNNSHGPPQLSKLIISKKFALDTLVNVETLELVVAADLRRTRRKQFKWIGLYESLDYLSVEFVAEEVSIESAALSVESGSNAVEKQAVELEDDAEDEWEGTDVSGQGSEDEGSSDSEDGGGIEYHNYIPSLSIFGTVDDPQLVDLIEMFHFLLTISLFDKRGSNATFVPLIEAIPPAYLITLSLDSASVPQQSIDATILRFQSLQNFFFEFVPCSALLLTNLATLPLLNHVSIGSFSDPSYVDLEAMIKPGPRQIKKLRNLDIELYCERGTAFQDVGRPYFDSEGLFAPHPDWIVPDFSPTFSYEEAKRLISMTEEEGIVLGGNLREAISVFEDFCVELAMSEEFQADANDAGDADYDEFMYG